MNLYKNLKSMIEYPKEGILSKEILKSGELNVSLFCMVSGTEISDHTATKKGMIYVIEGKGIFNLENKGIEMKPGVFIFMEEDQVHALKAQENTSFVLILA